MAAGNLYRPNSMTDTITQIAANVLGLETLETRNSDSLDFSDQYVAAIKLALEAAYEAGRDSAKPKPTAQKT